MRSQRRLLREKGQGGRGVNESSRRCPLPGRSGHGFNRGRPWVSTSHPSATDGTSSHKLCSTITECQDPIGGADRGRKSCRHSVRQRSNTLSSKLPRDSRSSGKDRVRLVYGRHRHEEDRCPGTETTKGRDWTGFPSTNEDPSPTREGVFQIFLCLLQKS